MRKTGLLILMGAWLAMGAGALAGAPPAPPPPPPVPPPAAKTEALDPAVEELLAFATDIKGLGRLRHKAVIARMAKIIPMTMTDNEPNLWVFRGSATAGPVASALIGWDGSQTFRDGDFKLRTDRPAALEKVLLARIEQKLGKPTYFYREKPSPRVISTHWFISNDWDISVGIEKNAKGVEFVAIGVNEYREPEDADPGETP